MHINQLWPGKHQMILDPDSFMIIPHVDVRFSAGNGRLVEFEPTPKMTGCAQRLEWFHKKKVYLRIL